VARLLEDQGPKLELTDLRKMFKPNLSILSASRRAVWEEFRATPNDFMLYGGPLWHCG
jgi:hypothetical protein